MPTDEIDEYKHQIRMTWLGEKFHYIINELIDELLEGGFLIDRVYSGASWSGNWPGPPAVALSGLCSDEQHQYRFDATWLKDKDNYSNPQDKWILESVQMEMIE
jgi:hypothetical protein